MKPTILVLDDDPDILDEVCETLEEEGFEALTAKTGAELRALTKSQRIDLFLLDLMLPDGNGLSLAKEIRHHSGVGIIIVTGKAAETDRVVGLEIGADDYVTKPFSPRELVARVRSVLRRTQGQVYHDEAGTTDAREYTRFQGWQLDLAAHHLTSPEGGDVPLTTAEFELLKAFVDSPNRVLSRDQLLNRVYGRDRFGYERGIDGLISRLRKKLTAPKGLPALIKTVRGAGYLFTAKVSKP